MSYHNLVEDQVVMAFQIMAPPVTVLISVSVETMAPSVSGVITDDVMAPSVSGVGTAC